MENSYFLRWKSVLSDTNWASLTRRRMGRRTSSFAYHMMILADRSPDAPVVEASKHELRLVYETRTERTVEIVCKAIFALTVIFNNSTSKTSSFWFVRHSLSIFALLNVSSPLSHVNIVQQSSPYKSFYEQFKVHAFEWHACFMIVTIYVALV